jgi:hypothetical protein
LIVVIAILGIAAVVAGVSPHVREGATRPDMSAVSDTFDLVLKGLRADAVSAGHPISRTILWNGGVAEMTAFPDGRILNSLRREITSSPRDR